MSWETDLKGHPCFNRSASTRYGRVHLPVAPRCNVKCRYCDRRGDCPNESGPGAASRVLCPDEALAELKRLMARDQRIRVAAVAGPGDPLANEETFHTLDLVHREFPELIKCLSTNGLLLSDRVPMLKALGVKSVTVTVNAVDPRVAEPVYEWVRYRDETYRGHQAAARLVLNQLEGIWRAVRLGLAVKVNTVLIPGVNEGHVAEVSRVVKGLGVRLMNVMPLVPRAGFRDLPAPGAAMMRAARTAAGAFTPQMDWCRQCRADAAGLLGECGRI
ncbi:MAG: radical SAM protein [Bacillota bacterium]|nr:radical SAM protein [Bacillota bacterium]